LVHDKHEAHFMTSADGARMALGHNKVAVTGRLITQAPVAENYQNLLRQGDNYVD
jgi:hypothetical protein